MLKTQRNLARLMISDYASISMLRIEPLNIRSFNMSLVMPAKNYCTSLVDVFFFPITDKTPRERPGRAGIIWRGMNRYVIRFQIETAILVATAGEE